MKRTIMLGVAWIWANCSPVWAQDSLSFIPTPNPAQLAWQEAELGFIFHYDLHVFDGKAYQQNGPTGNRTNPVLDYQAFAPEQLDTDQWIQAVKAAGGTFALITATHETGFALYQSEVNPYCMKALRWQDGKGDLVRDFVNSCRKYGIQPGIYLGIRWNSFFGVYDFQVNGEGEFQQNRQAYYNQMVEGMVKEICTQYGELFEIWFDGGASHPDLGAPDVLPIVKQYQPNCLFYHNDQLAEARWGGSESGTVAYPCWATFPYPSTGAGESAKREISANNFQLLKSGDPNGAYYMPAMSDAPLRGYNGRHEWFWEPGDEAHIFPLANLMKMYEQSVGRNSTLIIGLTPDPRGLLPEPDVARLEEWGAALQKRYGTPVASGSGQGKEVLLNLDQAATITDLILQEEVAYGERVREFVVEAYQGGKWQEMARGETIGHKRIQKIPPTRARRWRLRILQARANPMIRSFQVFD